MSSPRNMKNRARLMARIPTTRTDQNNALGRVTDVQFRQAAGALDNLMTHAHTSTQTGKSIQHMKPDLLNAFTVSTARQIAMLVHPVEAQRAGKGVWRMSGLLFFVRAGSEPHRKHALRSGSMPYYAAAG